MDLVGIKNQLNELWEVSEEMKDRNTIFMIKTLYELFQKFHVLVMGVATDEQGGFEGLTVSSFGCETCTYDEMKDVSEILLTLNALPLSWVTSEFESSQLTQSNLHNFAEIFTLRNGEVLSFERVLSQIEKEQILNSQGLASIAFKRAAKSL